MVTLVIRFSRLFTKGAVASARIAGLLNCHAHPRIHVVAHGAVACVYLAHIYVNVKDGFEIEHGVTALVAGTELLAHLLGG